MTKNISCIIKGHNSSITTGKNSTDQDCNCRNKAECPMDGKCRAKSTIYKCIVSSEGDPNKVYLGVCEGEWKTRFSNHKKSFNHRIYQKETSLSKYVWELKDAGKMPLFKWSIVKRIPAYSNISKRCLLCLSEKLMILTYEHQRELLNKRAELTSKCRHENKFLLKNYKFKDKHLGN